MMMCAPCRQNHNHLFVSIFIIVVVASWCTAAAKSFSAGMPRHLFADQSFVGRQSFWLNLLFSRCWAMALLKWNIFLPIKTDWSDWNFFVNLFFLFGMCNVEVKKRSRDADWLLFVIVVVVHHKHTQFSHAKRNPFAWTNKFAWGRVD